MKSLNHKFFLISFLFLIFSSCSYKGDFNQDELLANAPGVSLQNHGTTIVVNPATSTDTALVFYPGAYVNYDAYLPLMIKCAKKGVKCFLLQMPADLAILQISAADKYPSDYPEIKNWYIGGHSLGGAMAGNYISKHSDSYKGLILLAAYSDTDISKKNIKVLSIYGSNDGVLKKSKYDECKKNLPTSFEEHVLSGGNHGNFGSYGFQKGDKKASMDADIQKSLTADYIGDFCK